MSIKQHFLTGIALLPGICVNAQAAESVTPAGIIEGGAKRSFKPPFEGDAVLHLNGRTRNSK